MTKILWVKFGWSEFYRGGPVDGNFSYLAGKRKLGHEAYNFAPAANGTYYCYVPPQIKVHAPTHPDRTGWTVVCLAKHPKRKGVHIVGWYEDATLLGRWRDVPDTRARPPLADTDQGECWSYCITSKSAYFVPPQERNITFSHPSVRQGKFSFLAGPGVVATPNKNQVRKYLKHRLKKLKSVVIENPTDETAPDPGTDPADPLGGFGTPEHRKKVEKAAEKAVKRHYNAKGFSYVDVTKENPWVRFHLGFDFIFTKGRTELHVEVKGTSGELARFFMTRNENTYREHRAWRFAIVTRALSSKPTIRVSDNRQFNKAFQLTPYVFTGEPIVKPENI